ncbi:MAG TPA: UDP-N-acetylglucosamine 1-carboxyvinyltransferase [Lachnospiraceae bacterium]|nr:UDP-N-acetylglucosamine 1-carboxyvinyltransferase [Lachnospiraceae bacterium]
MGKYIIKGGKRLKGEVVVNGSKNAVLPILSASLINSRESVLTNCPDITDVSVTCEILKSLGCTVKRDGKVLTVNSSGISNVLVPKDMAEKMRSSILFLGVLLGKFGSVSINKPGGCAIGKRPVDIHLDALKALGAEISETDTTIECTAKELMGTDIYLPFASVGATENTMLAAVFAKGQTIIHNAAREPEIWALQEYMKTIGVTVRGAGTPTVFISGCKKYSDAEIDIISDRIEAGTYLTAAAMTKGEVFLKNINWTYMCKTLELMTEFGCEIKVQKDSIYLKAPKKTKSLNLIRTGVYPSFATDMQPIIMSLLTTSSGTSIIIEQMFENRFSHADELNKMGAKISAQTRVAIIEGVKQLKGAEVNATDLRAGAALIVAGLGAKGTTIVNNADFVRRGYENIEKNLHGLGAEIKFCDGEN